ncbi:hypothetical protein, partial [Streptomyces sp. JV178]
MPADLTLNQFILDTIAEFQRDNKGQRYGQFCFNRLAEFNPHAAWVITGTIYDPFYANDNNDPRIHRFWSKVE